VLKLALKNSGIFVWEGVVVIACFQKLNFKSTAGILKSIISIIVHFLLLTQALGYLLLKYKTICTTDIFLHYSIREVGRGSR